MVTEAVTEVVGTPPEDATVLIPESPTESAPAPENVEEPSAVDAFLESIGSASAGNAGDQGENAASDPVVPPAPVAPTPDQIRADERNRVETQNRINGLKWVITEDSPAKLARLESELSEEGREILRTELNRIKGAFDPLLQRAIDVDTNIAPSIRNAAATDAAAPEMPVSLASWLTNSR